MPTVITCTRRLQFAAGHRVLGHESKCAHLHGHNYTVHVTAQGPINGPDRLDPIGRVIDFGVLKYHLGRWIDENWDHGFLVGEQDKMVRALLTGFDVDFQPSSIKTSDVVRKQKFFVMPYNPTAENIARYLLTTVCPDLFRGTRITVIEVKIDETDNCSATARLGA